jgi:hypothetical protein
MLVHNCTTKNSPFSGGYLVGVLQNLRRILKNNALFKTLQEVFSIIRGFTTPANRCIFPRSRSILFLLAPFYFQFPTSFFYIFRSIKFYWKEKEENLKIRESKHETAPPSLDQKWLPAKRISLSLSLSLSLRRFSYLTEAISFHRFDFVSRVWKRSF